MAKLKGIYAALLVLGLLLQTVPSALAKDTVLSAEIVAKIRKEAMENSQILKTLHYYTDVYGPRLTGTPNLEKAGKWSMEQMKEWGFDKTEMEPWNFGSPGWTNDRASGFIISPVKDNLIFEVVAWTPGTQDAVVADALKMEFPTKQLGDNPLCVRGPTEKELNEYLNSMEGKIAGKIALLGAPSLEAQGVDFTPLKKRLTDDDLAGRSSYSWTPAPECPNMDVKPLEGWRVYKRLLKFLNKNKPAVLIRDAGLRHGIIRAFGNHRADPLKTPPTVIMRNEDYGRIWRLLDRKEPVKLEFNIKNTFYPQGATSYNTIGEITGTDKKDEVVMLGGHLDSWHSATGSTDNGIGCAIVMEAGRILKAIGVKPRRTIRIALWSGEEQGLLGSQVYVAKHFGTAENPKPAYHKFGGYFNVDTGTGRVREWSVFGPTAAGKILSDALTEYFKDLKFYKVRTVASRELGGSDHTSFNRAGLPGIGARQDPIEYFSHTWHTNLDTYERIVQEDVKATAAIVAAGVYELAMRDDLLPRFSKSKMPKIRSYRGGY